MDLTATRTRGAPDRAASVSWLSRAGVGGPPRPPTPRTVLLLVAGVAIAAILTALLRPWIEHTQFVLFYAVAVLAAYVGGLWLGTVAVILSLLAMELFLNGLAGVLAPSAALLVQTATVASVSLTTVWMVHWLRQARQRADAQRVESERLAADLEAQARELELQVTESEAMAAELEDLNQQLEEQTDTAARSARRAERLHTVTAHLLGLAAEPALLDAVAKQARLATDAAASAVFMKTMDGGVALAATDRDGLAGCRPLATAVLELGAPLWLDSPAALADRFAGLVAAPGLAAWAALPLGNHGGGRGVLLLGFDLPGEFRPEDRSFMLLLAQQCGQAMERVQLSERSLRARVRAEFAERRLAFLADASERLSASLDYHTSLAALARMAVPDLADACVVFLAGDDGAPRLVVASTRSHDAEGGDGRAGERAVAEAAFHRVVETGRPDLLLDLGGAGPSAPPPATQRVALLRSAGVRAQLAVPIASEDRVCGTLTLMLTQPQRTFGEADITLAVELGRRAGQAVQNARLYAAAQHASVAKSDFLAVMSHELRTPLNAIIGYADLILLGVPESMPDPARAQVQRIRVASDSLLQLVEEVLSFSRIEAGKEELRISPLDLSLLVRDAVALIEPLAHQKDLRLSLELPQDCLRLVSDEGKIRQIVTNLLSNAVKFTEQGEVRVSASATESEIRVDVVDTGIGIAAADLEHIFDPFWQVDRANTRRFGGTGLGLGVARKLARLLEGRLEVDTVEGAGSTFSLVLPRRTPGMPAATLLRA
jgi:signal transduction histidine kinase